ncbi:Uncharacterised protein [Moraxella caprae]|uniref:Uncharacterized protein n=1 Tax=Moraxella caprae TaxID=90240 RepID=A0A378R073_9GAMM|nr:hypothetical protein [Moraxella caprae]STZ08693.1 Uncharacterised protein [Moraxella caprae]
MALKILLAGFSGPSAGALTLLLQRNYPDVEYLVLERCFSDDLRLTLPTLGRSADDAFAAIVNLDGVGMSLFNDQHIKNLVDFLDFRASLLLTRSNIRQWQNADFLPHATSFFLSTPYTKQDMEAALSQLVSTATRLQENPVDAAKNRALIRTKAVGHLDDNDSATQGEFVQSVISTYFSGVCPNNVMCELIEIFSQEHPFKVAVGNQTVYVYPKKSIALVQSLERLLDYFSVAGNCQVLKTNITNTALSDSEFDRVLQNVKSQGYRRYSLNSFLWQIYSVILPTRINVPRNTLKLKIRYMPNFSGMKDIPEYVHAVVSSCLVVPKNLDQLDMVFGELTQKNPSILHRIFLLSILSGSADIDVLKRSFYTENPLDKILSEEEIKLVSEPEPVPELTPNKGVTQAAKTGFFKRLLSKLSF